MRMPRYFFNVVNDRSYRDLDGLELTDLEEARVEAVGFAGDLMRMEPERDNWSGCSIHVTDEEGTLVLSVPFRSGSASAPPG